VGGYDHAREAGVVHVADHHIAPGKKQWTWGNDAFGYAWDRNLTDEDGPYIELMAGVYADNQPDFSFLAPGETKTFQQYWYPIQKIGPVQKANTDAAVSLSVREGVARMGVSVTRAFEQAKVRLEGDSGKIAEWVRDLAPGEPMVAEATLPPGAEEQLALVVQISDGTELIRYTARAELKYELPPPASEPATPEQIESNDELYLTGLHLEQYRHATRKAEDYWREAVRRDPGDARANNALGLFHLRRGEFQQAEEHFRRAIGRLTRRNANPYDGEPYYNLGVALRFLHKESEAYDAFYKATWNHAWQAAGYHAIAELDARQGNWSVALEHLKLSLLRNADNHGARNLAAVMMRKLGATADAERALGETLTLDPLDAWACYIKHQASPRDNQMRIDIALDCARAGLFREAIDILSGFDQKADDGSAPMVWYALGYFESQLGNLTEAQKCYKQADAAKPDYCFPNRLEEMGFLEAAIEAHPDEARAPYYLGNLLYDRRRHCEAIACWEKAARLDASFATPWRNLGIGYFNVMENAEKARRAFDRAFEADRSDARVLYERDQLWKRMGDSPECRLRELEKFPELVQQRDDLSVELASLFNQTGQYEKALAVLASRKFQPWEGGEGLGLGQYVLAEIGLGRRALAAGDCVGAVTALGRALFPPDNLGEARHLLTNRSNLYYWLGAAYQGAGYETAARRFWRKAAAYQGDFQQMAVQRFSEKTYYTALAMRQLGKTEEADQLLRELLGHARNMIRQEVKIAFFATSLPAMLLFNDDPQKRNTVNAMFLEAQASLGLGQAAAARELLQQVLELDRNHAPAADLMAELDPTSSPLPAISA
jgi:tetratricopeptide (TPR) repeat protein